MLSVARRARTRTARLAHRPPSEGTIFVQYLVYQDGGIGDEPEVDILPPTDSTYLAFLCEETRRGFHRIFICGKRRFSVWLRECEAY